MEVAIKLANSEEIFRSTKTNHVVRLATQLFDRIGWAHRNGEHQAFRVCAPDPAQRCAHRAAGRDSIVDYDHGAIFELDARPSAAVELPAPMYLFELALNLAIEIVARDMKRTYYLPVENFLRMVPVDDCADTQFGLAGRAELA